MTARAAARLAWSAWAIVVALCAGSLALLALDLHTHVTGIFGFRGSTLLEGASYGTVGALVAARRRENPVGWLFLAAGLLSAAQGFGLEYGIRGILAEPGSLPGTNVAALVQGVAWIPPLGLITLLFLLFPSGRLPSPRWTPIAWLAPAAIALMTLGVLLTPGPLDTLRVSNPAGVEGLRRFLDAAAGLGLLVAGAGLVASAAAMLVRLRHARGEERAQLKWFVYAAAVVAVAILPSTLASDGILPGGGVFSVLLIVAIAGVPVAAGIAILRYRLYDIDRIINRTLVYGALSTGLGGLYFGIVVGLQAASSSVTRGSDLAVAGSTLVVAALFRPARRRIQALVDRRFYRSRVDAARTLDDFSASLRREIELESLTAELRVVVERTLQPAHVSLWLRPQKAER